MISQIVDPPERLRDEAQALAEKIAKNSPAAMAATKRALWGALEMGLTDACRAGAKELVSMWGHPDQEEGPARVRREARRATGSRSRGRRDADDATASRSAPRSSPTSSRTLGVEVRVQPLVRTRPLLRGGDWRGRACSRAAGSSRRGSARTSRPPDGTVVRRPTRGFVPRALLAAAGHATPSGTRGSARRCEMLTAQDRHVPRPRPRAHRASTGSTGSVRRRRPRRSRSTACFAGVFAVARRPRRRRRQVRRATSSATGCRSRRRSPRNG